ncbi:MAG: trehalase family glycosidase [Flavobacteriaceae bacterium]|nr:trehalase family glycosidase [Flavobacteriaceae bacterium]
MKTTLIKEAQRVLNVNYKEKGYSIPCKGLYPFQWLWDSGFIAIGFAHYDMPKAKNELTTLLSAQWANGFIPHIVFHEVSETYFPGPNYHRADLHPLSNKEYPSTGMTQPPVIGFVLEKIYQIAENKADVLNFIKENIGKIYNNHLYFYTNRDPKNEGLVYIYHNWESGTDNSPMWDGIWATMNSPEYSFERRDTAIVDVSQRPSKREYDHYLHIVEIAKKHNYNDQKIAELSPFLIQDPLFNSMLIKSNSSLIELYKIIGDNDDKIAQLQKWQEKSITSFNHKLFDPELGAYIHYDLRNEKPIRMVSSSSFAPLYAGIPSKEQAKELVNTMLTKFGGKGMYLCASFDPTSEHYNPKKYWRGPVWINLNWLLYYGLLDYEYNNIAQKIKSDSIEIIEKVGFYEYFDPRKSEYNNKTKGYGGSNFSWSAALLIDLINN